ncbi:MAG: hypothetical protein M1504_03100 [Candidatus Marsarchaeota archaeon]|nr:hypothetical protein [Candidatus Marsarchaeota archaeon]
MLSVDTSPYGANTFSDLSNACFSTGPNGSGSELQAWVESISGTTATVWVELTSSIPASGTQNIYMNLMAANDISSSGPIGEAPTLSATYGEYDNGASVFSFYDNFAGSSLSSLWSFVQTGGYGSYVVNNGITLSSSSGSGWVGPGILSTSTFNPASSVEDIHATGISGSGDFAEDWIYPAPTNSCAGANGLDCSVPGGTTEGYAMMYRIWTGTWAFQGYGPGGVDNQNEQGCSGATPPTSLEWNPSLATVEEGLQNYNGCLSGPSAADAPMQNSYVFVVVQYDPTSVTVQWVRVRAMPPGGMMPSPTLGSPVMG